MATLGAVVKLVDEDELSTIYETFDYNYFSSDFEKHDPKKFQFIVFRVSNTIRAIAKVQGFYCDLDYPEKLSFVFSKIIQKTYLSCASDPAVFWLSDVSEIEKVFASENIIIMERPEIIPEKIKLKDFLDSFASSHGIESKNIQLIITA